MRKPNQNILAVSLVLSSSVIIFVHVFIFPLYANIPKRRSAKLLGEYEQSLCMSNIKPVKVPHYWRHHCPKDGIVTVMQGGRLGNQMWEYASTWAVARRTGLEPYVPYCIRKVLDEVFEDLSIPPLGYVSHCRANWDSVVREPELWAHTNQSIVLPKFSVYPDLVLNWADDIRHEFRFKKKLEETSHEVLESVGHPSNITTTYVGVHVRRMDYRGYLWRSRKILLADAEYFLTAMNYFRNKYGEGVIFLVVSDDPGWCRRNLAEGRNDVFVVSKKGVSAGQDLALMAACNHTIIDYGTFGLWGAILANGETILYNISKHSTLRVAELLANWHVVN